jgi:hypothetical protein
MLTELLPGNGLVKSVTITTRYSHMKQKPGTDINVLSISAYVPSFMRPDTSKILSGVHLYVSATVLPAQQCGNN